MADSPSPPTEPDRHPAAAIDRTSPVPFYFQLRTLLEDDIRSGRRPAGTRLPAETELCKQYGISRSTVRQALRALELDQLVHRERGLGTFVSQPRRQSWLLQSSDGVFQQDVARMGHRISTRLLRAMLEPLPGWASDALAVPPGADGVTLERVRSVDGKAALYVVTHLPATTADTVIGADLAALSLYDLLHERLGLQVHGARRTLEAVEASGLAELLEVAPGSPLAFIESVSWDQAGRPFDCYRAWLRTDRMPVEIAVSALTTGADGTAASA